MLRTPIKTAIRRKVCCRSNGGLGCTDLHNAITQRRPISSLVVPTSSSTFSTTYNDRRTTFNEENDNSRRRISLLKQQPDSLRTNWLGGRCCYSKQQQQRNHHNTVVVNRDNSSLLSSSLTMRSPVYYHHRYHQQQPQAQQQYHREFSSSSSTNATDVDAQTTTTNVDVVQKDSPEDQQQSDLGIPGAQKGGKKLAIGKNKITYLLDPFCFLSVVKLNEWVGGGGIGSEEMKWKSCVCRYNSSYMKTFVCLVSFSPCLTFFTVIIK